MAGGFQYPAGAAFSCAEYGDGYGFTYGSAVKLASAGLAGVETSTNALEEEEDR